MEDELEALEAMYGDAFHRDNCRVTISLEPGAAIEFALPSEYPCEKRVEIILKAAREPPHLSSLCDKVTSLEFSMRREVLIYDVVVLVQEHFHSNESVAAADASSWGTWPLLLDSTVAASPVVTPPVATPSPEAPR